MENWTEKASPTDLVDSGEISLASLTETWKRQIRGLPLENPQIVTIGSQLFVVKVVKKRAEEVLPLDQVREQIVGELTDRKRQEILQTWVNSLKGPNLLEINKDADWP